jgi:uncharacterized protein (DUF2267 family)
MMMAHDTRDRGPSLKPESIAELTAALDAYIRDEKSDELRRRLQGIAVEARELGMHAEQLLVVLKDVWYAQPSLREGGNEVDQTRLLQRVVSICIREYYGG